MSIPGFAWALERGASLALHAADRLVLIYLADKANGIGVCWPGQETIVRFTGLSLRTVRTSVRRLASLGLISLEEAAGIATRYHVNRELTQAKQHRDTPANGTGGKHADPGKPARGTPANGIRAPRQVSTPNPGKSCIEPRQNLHATPANQPPEPLREPLREPKTRAHAREEGAGLNSQSSPEPDQPPPSTRSSLLPADLYAPPDEARAVFAAFLAAKRRAAHPEDEAPEPKAPGKQVRRAAAATIYALRPKYAPAPGVKPARTRNEQVDAMDGGVIVGEILPPIRRGPVDPIRTVAEQIAALGCSP